jgi:hypothetical protein
MEAHIHLLAHGYGDSAEEAKSQVCALVAKLMSGRQA